MQRRAAFEAVFRGGLVVVHLLPPVDQPLLRRRNPFLLLHALLDLLHLVIGLDVEFDFLAGQGTDFDLHIE